MRWSESETYQFVKLYLSYDNLWDIEHEDHKIKDKRIKSYKDITSEFMTATGILLNEQELKSKIKNLRSTYLQELSKINQRSSGDYEYIPTIKWFGYWDACFRKKRNLKINDSGFKVTVIYLKDKESELVQDQSKNMWLTGEESETLSGEQDLFQANKDDNYVLVLKTEPGLQPKRNKTQKYKMQRKKIKQRSPSTDISDQTFKRSLESLDICQEDEFDIYGKYIASQLRSMDLKRALRLQFEIQSLISGARLSELSN